MIIIIFTLYTFMHKLHSRQLRDGAVCKHIYWCSWYLHWCQAFHHIFSSLLFSALFFSSSLLSCLLFSSSLFSPLPLHFSTLPLLLSIILFLSVLFSALFCVSIYLPHYFFFPIPSYRNPKWISNNLLFRLFTPTLSSYSMQ